MYPTYANLWTGESLFPEVELCGTVQISNVIWSVLQSSLVAAVTEQIYG